MGQRGSGSEIREYLRQIDPYDFEEFVADLWGAQGWDAEATSGSGEMGVDVVAHRSGGMMDTKAVIQAKRYASERKVGRPEMQQYYTLREQDPEADVGVVVTTSAFTPEADSWATAHNVKTVDGDQLVELIQENGLEGRLREYVTGEPAYQSAGKSTAQGKTGTDGVESDFWGLVTLVLLAQVSALFLLGTTDFLRAVSDQMATWLFVAAWFGAPVIAYLDASELHQKGAKYRPNRIVWPFLIFFIPVIGIASYTYKRAKVRG